MAKTAQDVLTRAFRMMGVTEPGANLEAEYYADGLIVLQGILDELKDVQGATFTWTVNTVPDGVFLPLASLVAADLAPQYPVTANIEPRSRAMARVRAFLFPDDIAIRADIDDSGTVDDGETEADARAVYF